MWNKEGGMRSPGQIFNFLLWDKGALGSPTDLLAKSGRFGGHCLLSWYFMYRTLLISLVFNFIDRRQNIHNKTLEVWRIV